MKAWVTPSRAHSATSAPPESRCSSVISAPAAPVSSPIVNSNTLASNPGEAACATTAPFPTPHHRRSEATMSAIPVWVT